MNIKIKKSARTQAEIITHNTLFSDTLRQRLLNSDNTPTENDEKEEKTYRL